MTRLNLQDSLFLKLESPDRPFHIAGLALCTPPEGANSGYLRDLQARLCAIPEMFEPFGLKLSNPGLIGSQSWIEADDYDADYHVFHYALPQPGDFDDLIKLLSRVHERMLDRSRPLWEIHLIEGLPGGRFAFYCKFHHAIMDGVGALHMVRELFSASAEARLDITRRHTETEPKKRPGLGQQLSRLSGEVMEQSRAIPELYGMLGTMGKRGWLQGQQAPPLPFTAPHTLFNQNITSHRQLATVRLPLNSIRKIGAAHGGTINDVIIAICGGAIRTYLLAQDALPKKSLFAGVPVSVEPSGTHKGNQLSTMICPFGTDVSDPRERIARIVHITRQAKDDLHHVTRAASQDYMNLLLIPGLVLTLAGAATRVPPPFNVILSNVPGPKQQLYLNGASVDTLYPLSLITDAQGLNITALSYRKKLCLGIVACPSIVPAIDTLVGHIKQAHRELSELS
jgi:diacylglycerol O-acyltransferase